jgi:8-oxo-dGTP pyrophosphatase MutT (NUDIX family)
MYRDITFLKTIKTTRNSIPLAHKMAGKAYPPFRFTAHPSTSPFTVCQQKYLSQHPDERFQYIAIAALVFDTTKGIDPRILLLQRSAQDSMPNRWEVPGGGCDDEDESILHGLARELWEEAGLNATHIEPSVGEPHFFTSRSGKNICKFLFVVQVEQGADGQLNVRLDPDEHRRFVWASQDEFKAKRVGDVELEFSTRDLENTVLQSFEHIEKRSTQ